MHLTLINGKPGTGKTSVSRALLGKLPQPAAWIDTDDLMRVRPFDAESTFRETLERAILLMHDFAARGTAHLILSGCVHSSDLVSQLQNDPMGAAADVQYVLLTTSPDIADARKRAQGYSIEKHATMFEIIHGTHEEISEETVKPWAWHTIETSSKTVEKVALEISRL